MTVSDFKNLNGWLTIAPFDHRGSLAKSLSLNLSDPIDQTTFTTLKRLFMQILSPHVSAVLTDPEFGIKTLDAKDPTTRVFLSLEKSGYSSDHDAITEVLENPGLDGMYQLGAGAKILVYYHPRSRQAVAKLDLVKRLYEEALKKEVILLVEPVLYATKEADPTWKEDGDEDWIETHLTVCRQFAPCCDILKVQYPGNMAACAQVSSMHQNWILLSRAVDFATFKNYLLIASRQGCKGYAAGRAVWQELTEYKTATEWERFLKTTAVSRLEELNALLETIHLIA